MLLNNSRNYRESEIRRLTKNVGQRVKKIEGLASPIPFIVIDKYKEFKQNLPKNLKGLSDKEIDSLYRQIKYLNDLKTSRVSYVKDLISREDLVNRQYDFNDLVGKDNMKRVREIIGKVEELIGPYIVDQFKYTIEDYVVARVARGEKNIDKVAFRIANWYDKSRTKAFIRGDDDIDKSATLLFSKELSSVLKKYK